MLIRGDTSDVESVSSGGTVTRRIRHNDTHDVDEFGNCIQCSEGIISRMAPSRPVAIDPPTSVVLRAPIQTQTQPLQPPTQPIVSRYKPLTSYVMTHHPKIQVFQNYSIKKFEAFRQRCINDSVITDRMGDHAEDVFRAVALEDTLVWNSSLFQYIIRKHYQSQINDNTQSENMSFDLAFKLFAIVSYSKVTSFFVFLSKTIKFWNVPSLETHKSFSPHFSWFMHHRNIRGMADYVSSYPIQPDMHVTLNEKIVKTL